ncbi:MAG: tungstate transporter permease [Pseudomonadota bacterium]
MEHISQATQQAFWLLFSGDKALWMIIASSLKVSLLALSIATPFALLLAFLLAHTQFVGRRFLIAWFNVLLAFPSVVMGLLLYLLLSRQGIFGDLKLLFTQTAMVLGQILLSFPVLVAMGHAALQAADKRAFETAITLGASPIQAMFSVMYETRFGLIAALIVAFGRIISEIGCSMMVGGNILNYTRNIPTAIALETSKGEFSQGIALGMVLLFIALLLNVGLASVQGKGEVMS